MKVFSVSVFTSLTILAACAQPVPPPPPLQGELIYNKFGVAIGCESGQFVTGAAPEDQCLTWLPPADAPPYVPPSSPSSSSSSSSSLPSFPPSWPPSWPPVTPPRVPPPLPPEDGVIPPEDGVVPPQDCPEGQVRSGSVCIPGDLVVDEEH